MLRDVKRAPCAPDGQGAADAASRGAAASSDGATHSDEVSQLTLTLTLTLTPTPTPTPTPNPHPNPHQVSQEELGAALAALADRGFVNYFGLQRFGANAAASTHTVGLSLTLTQTLTLALALTLTLPLTLTLTLALAQALTLTPIRHRREAPVGDGLDDPRGGRDAR